ncbi:MAG: fructose-6-phosphate aldolase [Candidatus Izemoplasmatales bacterium]|jgi:transaldolase|nr:fructose-6-phosphate aldolase [Candidatus Izemoplasmatales bacterium]MDD3865039.1 fructose-6-phosphate aldolase [Candidatus Izemoplasmatales bacterium]
MKLFIDTANLAEIKTASTWGIISGVTTNPSLIAKEGRNIVDVIKEITTLIDGPISAEVQEGLAEAMIETAFDYAKMHSNIVIKIPMTMEGIKAVSVLSKHGIKTNVTLCFSVSQAMMAAKAGATFVSPFMGRLDDATNNPEAGYELLQDIRLAYDNYHIQTEIIAASIRHPLHAEQAALAGADIATIPYKVFLQMIEHPLTAKGLDIFRKAEKQ